MLLPLQAPGVKCAPPGSKLSKEEWPIVKTALLQYQSILITARTHKPQYQSFPDSHFLPQSLISHIIKKFFLLATSGDVQRLLDKYTTFLPDQAQHLFDIIPRNKALNKCAY